MRNFAIATTLTIYSAIFVSQENLVWVQNLIALIRFSTLNKNGMSIINFQPWGCHSNPLFLK